MAVDTSSSQFVLADRSVCVKRALPRLKVAADWRAPIERNRWEVEWMRVAATVVPSAVPSILGEDRDAGCFAMAFLDRIVDGATGARWMNVVKECLEQPWRLLLA